MAGTSLLVLLDDIASVLDDVATMTKVAARKTAGVLGDDLAVNAEKVTGVRAQRELPVVWAVARGSLLNKAILVPAALLISWILPWLITPLLMLGGLYLCYEGFEKIVHSVLHREEEAAHRRAHVEHLKKSPEELLAFERRRIRGAVRTDFILSAEIIVLTLGIVADMPFATKALVLVAIALFMTVSVYGLVAAIVKLDDIGAYLLALEGDTRWRRLQRWVGDGLLSFAPWLMKALGIVGTIAMFMVGGGILLHGLHAAEAAVAATAAQWSAISGVGPLLSAVTPTLAGALLGVLAGAVAVGLVSGVQRLRGA